MLACLLLLERAFGNFAFRIQRTSFYSHYLPIISFVLSQIYIGLYHLIYMFFFIIIVLIMYLKADAFIVANLNV